MDRPRQLWNRLVSSEADFKAVYEAAIMPEIRKRISDLSSRIELQEAPVPCGDGWRCLPV